MCFVALFGTWPVRRSTEGLKGADRVAEGLISVILLQNMFINNFDTHVCTRYTERSFRISPTGSLVLFLCDPLVEVLFFPWCPLLFSPPLLPPSPPDPWAWVGLPAFAV